MIFNPTISENANNSGVVLLSIHPTSSLHEHQISVKYCLLQLSR